MKHASIKLVYLTHVDLQTVENILSLLIDKSFVIFIISLNMYPSLFLKVGPVYMSNIHARLQMKRLDCLTFYWRTARLDFPFITQRGNRVKPVERRFSDMRIYARLGRTRALVMVHLFSVRYAHS